MQPLTFSGFLKYKVQPLHPTSVCPTEKNGHIQLGSTSLPRNLKSSPAQEAKAPIALTSLFSPVPWATVLHVVQCLNTVASYFVQFCSCFLTEG